MTRDDIIRMAREAGGTVMEPYDYGARPDRMILRYEVLERFAALVAAAEREACAKACEDQRDLREEARAALRLADALNKGNEDDMLRALRHDSDVRLYHCGLDKAASAIRARGNV